MGFQANRADLATIEGIAFSPENAFQTPGLRTDARIPGAGSVVLTPLSAAGSIRAPVNDTGSFALAVAPGTYSIALLTSPDFLPFRRAHIRGVPGGRTTINLYPIQHTGIAMTVHGCVRLPDPVLLYDSYQPDEHYPDLDMLIQYQHRAKTAEGFRYESSFLTLTFDALTLQTRMLRLNRQTLRAEAPEAFLDIGSFRTEAKQVQLDARRRVIAYYNGAMSEERSF